MDLGERIGLRPFREWGRFKALHSLRLTAVGCLLFIIEIPYERRPGSGLGCAPSASGGRFKALHSLRLMAVGCLLSRRLRK